MKSVTHIMNPNPNPNTNPNTDPNPNLNPNPNPNPNLMYLLSYTLHSAISTARRKMLGARPASVPGGRLFLNSLSEPTTNA